MEIFYFISIIIIIVFLIVLMCIRKISLKLFILIMGALFIVHLISSIALVISLSKEPLQVKAAPLILSFLLFIINSLCVFGKWLYRYLNKNITAESISLFFKHENDSNNKDEDINKCQ